MVVDTPFGTEERAAYFLIRRGAPSAAKPPTVSPASRCRRGPRANGGSGGPTNTIVFSGRARVFGGVASAAAGHEFQVNPPYMVLAFSRPYSAAGRGAIYPLSSIAAR